MKSMPTYRVWGDPLQRQMIGGKIGASTQYYGKWQACKTKINRNSGMGMWRHASPKQLPTLMCFYS